MSDENRPADLDVQAARSSRWRNLSVVWLVPILALAVSLAVAWRSFADRGELIEIVFQNAAGVKAGETTLNYREVVIGTVEKVGFTDDLEQVVVSARVDKKIAPFLNSSAQFWVVRPEVSAAGVSGLSTVLSGVYIEGTWDKSGEPALTRFQGLEQRPLIGLNSQGTRITLQTDDGSIMSAGMPVFYRGVEVGRTEKPRLDDSGAMVLLEAFIDAPHDRLLTTATRFWDTSGFSVSIGTEGLKLDVGSFATLVTGGIAFDTFFSGGRPVESGQKYELYADRSAARDDAFSRVSGNVVTLATSFDGEVSGLSPGAPLQYEGLKIGKVSTLSAFVTGEGRDMQVHQKVILEVDPELMGLPNDATLADVLDLLEPAVDAGLRARVSSANLLGSSLIVELVEIEDAPPATLDRDADPYPTIPGVQSDLKDISATLEGVMKRVNSLKIEDLIEQAISAMASIEAIASNEKLREVPDQIVGVLEDARSLIGSEETRALPGELRDTIADLRATVKQITTDGVIDRLVSTLKSADAAMANLSTASDEFPALVTDLRAVVAKANDLKVQELIESATDFLDSADALIATEDARAVPASLNASLDELRTLLAELREGGAVDNANSALASVRSASDSLDRATQNLPELTARLDRLIARSEDLITAYGTRSDFNSETLSMLREVRSAARTITALARSLERSPNSILFGK